ncbi:MAG: mechanosensitive ion channel [Bacteroidales bacterium]|nr:mechanosensitive ion channel [Bacteroidales bacterium]MBN2818270.1 mechanosensitive ion channel [Bacteroidales bacterium]
MEKLNQISDYLVTGVLTQGPKVLYALIALLVGLWVIKAILKITVKGLNRRNVDDSLKGFIKSFISVLLKTLLVVSVIGMLGIQMTSFIAILGAAGLAVGMALSGMLQNFAGGVMILIFKPFKVGDYISAQGHSGSVKEIQIFNTILKTPDNITIIIPNGGLSTGSMINFSAEDRRRVDLIYGIGYSDDIDKARGVILDVINANESILKDPEPFVKVVELGDSSVNFTVRLWVEAANYWDVFFYMQETVKKSFDKKGISIPFPQSDVHLHKV